MYAEEESSREAGQNERGFLFLHGLAGLLGGFIVTAIGALWFGSAQFVYPTQAAVAMWFAIIGMGLIVLAPLWYWLGRPIYIRSRRTTVRRDSRDVNRSISKDVNHVTREEVVKKQKTDLDLILRWFIDTMENVEPRTFVNLGHLRKRVREQSLQDLSEEDSQKILDIVEDYALLNDEIDTTYLEYRLRRNLSPPGSSESE